MSLSNPLRWPINLPRTKAPRPAPFKVGHVKALSDLYDELERIGAASVAITSNAVLNLNGTMRATQPRFVGDTGVAVYFVRKGREMVMACDRWNFIGDNIRAIGLSLAAIRGLDRWGASNAVEAALSGFVAIPETTGSGEAWWKVLGVDPFADAAMIEAAYRANAKSTHPDRGGNADDFRRLTEARDAGIAARAGRRATG